MLAKYSFMVYTISVKIKRKENKMIKATINLNGNKITTRKFKELFGEEAWKEIKRLLKNVCFEHTQKTEFGLLEIRNEIA
jgi:hypothetical protein